MARAYQDNPRGASRWRVAILIACAAFASSTAIAEDKSTASLHADLLALGFGQPTAVGEPVHADDVETAAEQYAEFWGLPTDFRMLAAVSEHLQTRGCFVADLLHAGEDLETAEANWPTSCRDDIGLFIDWGNFSESTVGFSQAKARAAISRACDHWNEKIGVRLYVSEDVASAKTYVRWERLAGSTLAWSHLANNSCRDDKQQRYDLRRWSEHQLFITALHEIGHLIGLPHRRGNYVMNPVIITSLSGLTDRDIADARNLGYGDPFDPRPQPPAPPPPGPTPRDRIAGRVKLRDGTTIDAADIRSLEISIEDAPTKPDGPVIYLPPITLHLPALDHSALVHCTAH